MSDIKDGGSAFPLSVAISPICDEHIAYTGMSLRDYFAAKAMHALLSNPSSVGINGETISKAAYGVANRMLDAREAK